ncbi:unnamed protein product [Arctogadus glacialis]
MPGSAVSARARAERAAGARARASTPLAAGLDGTEASTRTSRARARRVKRGERSVARTSHMRCQRQAKTVAKRWERAMQSNASAVTPGNGTRDRGDRGDTKVSPGPHPRQQGVS